MHRCEKSEKKKKKAQKNNNNEVTYICQNGSIHQKQTSQKAPNMHLETSKCNHIMQI